MSLKLVETPQEIEPTSITFETLYYDVLREIISHLDEATVAVLSSCSSEFASFIKERTRNLDKFVRTCVENDYRGLLEWLRGENKVPLSRLVKPDLLVLACQKGSLETLKWIQESGGFAFMEERARDMPQFSTDHLKWENLGFDVSTAIAHSHWDCAEFLIMNGRRLCQGALFPIGKCLPFDRIEWFEEKSRIRVSQSSLLIRGAFSTANVELLMSIRRENPMVKAEDILTRAVEKGRLDIISNLWDTLVDECTTKSPDVWLQRAMKSESMAMFRFVASKCAGISPQYREFCMEKGSADDLQWFEEKLYSRSRVH